MINFIVFAISSLAFALESPLQSPEIKKRIIEDREIMTQAKLDGDDYSFYAGMQVNASPTTALDRLTDYPAYQKMSRFVTRSEKLPNGWVRIEGGVFGFRLESSVQVDRKVEASGIERLDYVIREGGLLGLRGQVRVEALPKKGSWIVFDGKLRGKNWPPAFVMERGAEMVFGFAARFMRKSMETEKDDDVPRKFEEAPRPRKKLSSGT
ncbi:MAG: hypothetical protein JNL01_09590 [Bdellovibrionales bacterium]|nr:hypothetical protein [Bdellovibrionales bacterium]